MAKRIRERLNLPPKTPDNSSTPPSQGQKASEDRLAATEAEGQAACRRAPAAASQSDARRDVLADPAEHCGADVSRLAQTACEAYDQIEIPEIVPDVTRVTLHGGVCPCCAQAVQGGAAGRTCRRARPSGRTCALFVIYLRFTQASPSSGWRGCCPICSGSTSARARSSTCCDAARGAFARQTSLIRDRLLSGTILQSDETGLRVGKKNWWLWVFHHDDSAVFVAEPIARQGGGRGLPRRLRPDFWVSDRYGGQDGLGGEANIRSASPISSATCNTPSTRATTSLRPALRHLLGRACRIGRRRDRLADATLKTYAARLEPASTTSCADADPAAASSSSA